MKHVDTTTRGEDLYQRLLLQEILKVQREMRDEQTQQGKDIAGLKVKAGIWGTVGGALSVGIYALGAFIKGVARG